MVIVSRNYRAQMAAKAILTCQSNSHPFQERTLLLVEDRPIKVGRSVARAKATPTNAVFDCKVLSRNHAMLMYKDEKFYLQDTRSSNGTFVNNHKLNTEIYHELFSGDVVQFGVDVVENNRKVTHGCIIAVIKLYLPDGKEKASPAKDDRHEIVPLDDLYKLNQIIQEANQREQCLENKLTELQNAVIETRKSAEENWYTYVGEERLLSRVSALETQLQYKNWGEDKLKEEILKLQEESEAYQIAAKEALEKLHGEKLEAVALAMEKERARLAAEQEAVLAKEQFAQIQLELELIAKRLTAQQREAEEEKLRSLENVSITDIIDTYADQEMNEIIYNDDIMFKEDLLAENEVCESLNKSNGSLCLTVGPVEESKEIEDEKSEVAKTEEETKRVTFSISKTIEEEKESSESQISSDESKNDKNESEKDDVDSKTLKYQFQSAQNEMMKRRIESLEGVANANKSVITELRNNLDREKEISRQCKEDNERLREEFVVLQQKWKETCNENQQYRDKISNMGKELELVQRKCYKTQEEFGSGDCTIRPLVHDQLINLEEELIVMKERFAQISDEKLRLQRDLINLTERYNLVCNRSYNKYFFYVAPLVIMVLYLLVSAMIS